MEGFALFRRFTKEDNARARQLIEKAIELDAGFATAYAGLGWIQFNAGRRKWSEDPTGSFRMAEELANKALSIDDTLAIAHGFQSNIHAIRGQHGQAFAAAKRGLAFEPNSPNAMLILGSSLISGGRTEEALPVLRKAIRIHPYAPFYFHTIMSRAFFFTGHYEEAINALNKARLRNEGRSPRLRTRAFLIASYIEAGQETEAAMQAKTLLQKYPKFSSKAWAINHFQPYKDRETIVPRFAKLLRKAGLPE